MKEFIKTLTIMKQATCFVYTELLIARKKQDTTGYYKAYFILFLPVFIKKI